LNDEPLIVEGGEQTRDPNYILNMIDGFVQLTEAPEDKVVGEVFHIGSGEEITIRKLAETCISVASSKSQIVEVPYRPGETGLRQKMNTEKAKRVLHYRPRIKLCDGLKFTLQWLRDES
jgi:nucleoside-diphosphate-sugar epimerase